MRVTGLAMSPSEVPALVRYAEMRKWEMEAVGVFPDVLPQLDRLEEGDSVVMVTPDIFYDSREFQRELMERCRAQGIKTHFMMFPISPSRMKNADCLFFFFCKYVLAIPEEATLPLQVGRFCHLVMERYNNALMLARTEADVDVFEQVFDDTWGENTDIPDREAEDIHDFMYRFVSNYTIYPHFTTHTEKPFAFSWDWRSVAWDDPSVWLRAKIDRIDAPTKTRVEIIDFKTNWSVPPLGALRMEPQTRVYPLACQKEWQDYREFKVEYSYIRSQKSRVFEFVMDDLLSVERRLKRFTTKMISLIADPYTTWKPMTGDLCAICSYPCPLLEKGEVRPVRTLEDAVRVGQEVQVLKSRADALSATLRDFVKEYGTVNIGSGEYEMEDSVSISIKPEVLVDILGSNQTNFWPFLSANAAAIKKLPDGDLKNMILTAAKIDTRQTMKFVDRKKEIG